MNFDHNRDLDDTIDIEDPPQAVVWLQRSGLIDAGECPRIEVLPGGVSSRTVLVDRVNGRPMVLKQSLPKLRVAVDWFSSPERIHREALAIRWFSQLAPPGAITQLFFEDLAQHIIAMEAVPKPHANWKTMLLAGDVRTDHFRQFGRLLGDLHRNSADRRREVESLFGDKVFFETLRVEPYYRYTAHYAPDFLNALIEETLATNVSLVHGDFSPKNVLLHRDRMVLLDHEVAHFGDPAFDIGFAMAHLLSKAHHLPDLRNRFLEGAFEFWVSYRDWKPYAGYESRCVRHSLACLLARVCGRSPLEYLDSGERSRQTAAVLAIMRDAPFEINALIDIWKKEIACR